MKHAAYILFLALALSVTKAAAQNVVLGERVPELRNLAWLDNRQPDQAAYTFIEFYHTSNREAEAELERLTELVGKLGTKLRVIVVTKESVEKVAPRLRPYVSQHMGVAFDHAGRGFAAFGVNYLPFGVLVDARNRAQWLGNPSRLTEKQIKEIIR